MLTLININRLMFPVFALFLGFYIKSLFYQIHLVFLILIRLGGNLNYLYNIIIFIENRKCIDLAIHPFIVFTVVNVLESYGFFVFLMVLSGQTYPAFSHDTSRLCRYW